MTTLQLQAVRAAEGIAAADAERPLLISCAGERLLGVLHPAAGSIGIVVVVGGPQYRAGSHRHFVKLARSLAAASYPVLRFDARGMGDSSGTLHGFEHIGLDVGAAMAALQSQQPQVRHVVLWGLCDGASAALLYLHERPDLHVAGLCLLNPWVRSAQSLARTHVKHYYRQRLLQKEFWLKLLRGGVMPGAFRSLLDNLKSAGRGGDEPAQGFQTRMAIGWQRHAGPVLLVLSGDDYTAREFVEYTSAASAWRGLIDHPEVQKTSLPFADHTFSRREDERQLERIVADWLSTLPSARAT